MLVREGDSRTSKTDRRLACSLATVAGALNTAGFYAFGLYSSHMTGTVSALADHLALADLTWVAVYATIIATFVSGAAVSTMLINRGRRRGVQGVYAFSICVEALLLALLGAGDLWLPEVHRSPALIFGLAFLMGLQNAVVTRISNARIRTTHVTGMVTDIGIELGHLMDIAHFGGASDEAALNREKLQLHLRTVLSFLVGGVLGVLGYRAIGAGLMFCVAFVLLTLAGPALIANRVSAGEDVSA